MRTLQHPLIADRSTRQLSALGYKQLWRIIDKAAKVKGTHRYASDFKPVQEQVRTLVLSLIFDHGITKEQLSTLQKSIKVINDSLQLPDVSYYQVAE